MSMSISGRCLYSSTARWIRLVFRRRTLTYMLISLVFFVVPSIYLFRPNVFNQTRYIPSLYIRESRESSRADSSDYCFKEMTDFKAAVKRQVGPDGMILLPSSVDRGYLKMALNFYETSIVRNNIKNVLMICSDRQACIELWKRCIPAFLYVEDEAGGEAQEFLSTDFIRKSRRKIYWIQDVLNMGYSPVISDLDIHYNSNPMPLLNQPGCDLEMMVNVRLPKREVEFNGGWMVFINTPGSKRWSDLSVKRLNNASDYDDDQMILNEIIEVMRRNKEPLNVCELKEDVFSSGIYYYETGERQFHDSPGIWQTPAVVHNNFIVGADAKVFRFRQHLMWLEDEDGYYSDPSRKYLVYGNPKNFDGDNPEIEKRALRSAVAIALITNRTLILPRFHCACDNGECTELCPFLTNFYFTAFNEQFPGIFREESFLEHPKVPEHVKQGNNNKIMFIQSDRVDKVFVPLHEIPGQTIHTYSPSDTEKGATDTEIKSWLLPLRDMPLLKFECLYDAFSEFENQQENEQFEKRASNGIQFSEVRQREVSVVPGRFRNKKKIVAFRKQDMTPVA